MSPPEQSIQISSRSNIDKTALKAKEMDIQVGLLGKLFGSVDNAPVNVSGLLAIIFVVAGVGLCFVQARIEPADYWKVVLPVITTILGYLFGRHTKS